MRVWHSGPPPHVGWWNASTYKDKAAWRWWDGDYWSKPAYRQMDSFYAQSIARKRTSDTNPIEWTLDWPEGARVPRIDPRKST